MLRRFLSDIVSEADASNARQRREEVAHQEPRRGETRGAKNHEITKLLWQFVHRHGQGCAEPSGDPSHPGKANGDSVDEVVKTLDDQVGNAICSDAPFLPASFSGRVYMGFGFTLGVAVAWAHRWDCENTQSSNYCRNTHVRHVIMASTF